MADWQNASFDDEIACRCGIPGKHWEWGGEPGNSYIKDLRSPAPNQEYQGMRITTWTRKWSVKRANLPPEPGKEPKDPEITPSV